jgi:outer membrane receptor protein involved in Fe transport
VQWEVGTQGNIVDDRLFYGVSVFRIDRSNVAVGLPPPNPQGFVRGIGGQIHQGVEFELMGEPLPGWNLFGSYSYLSVEVTESANPNEIGKQRANSPRSQFKLYSNYEIKDGPLRGLTLGGGLMYFSSRMIDNIGSYQFDPYTRLDLSLSYRLSDNIQLSLSGINILDEKIVNSISGTSGSANGGIIYQDPRMYYAKIALRY